MKFTNAIKVYRKSGGALQSLLLNPQPVHLAGIEWLDLGSPFGNPGALGGVIEP